MDDAIRSWVTKTLGGRLVHEHRPSTGGSRSVVLADLVRDDGSQVPIVVRCEGDGSFTGTEVSLEREAAVYRALATTAVPTPEVLALSPDADVLVLERLAGTSELPPAGSEERATTMADFVDAVATLHRLDVGSLDLPGFARPQAPVDHARSDLAMWARLGAGSPALDPLLRFAGGWLWEHAPRHAPHTVLVQGDTGPGNFLAENGRVTGLVDWEFAHVGDPMDDWAWIEMRSDPDELPAMHARYTARSRIAIDPERIAYYRLAVDYRCAITTTLAVRRGGGARGWAAYLLATQRFLDGLATRLAARFGLDLVIASSEPPDTPRTPWYDELLTGIRTAVVQLDDDDTRDATRNLQILVRYLRAFDRIGPHLANEERVDRSRTLGDDALDDARLGERAESAGRASDRDFLRFLLRRHARDRQLWAELLDRTVRP